MSDFSLQIPSLDLSQDDKVVSEETPELLGSDSIASPFLAAIPEQDRNIVAKYIKDWDAGVTKKFQGIHEQYKPYKELGDYERVKMAMDVVAVMEEDPQLFYENLAQALGLNEEEMSDIFDPAQNEQPQNQNTDPRDAEISDLRAMVESMQTNFQQSQQSAVEKQQMDELDNYIKNMHNEHGDFDEDWVLLQISKGTDPVEAVKSWNSMINDKVGSFAKRPSPNILSGQGSSPGNQVDPSKFDAKQRKDYIAEMLSAASQQ